MIVEGAGRFHTVIEDNRPFPLFALDNILIIIFSLLIDIVHVYCPCLCLPSLYLLLFLSLLSDGIGPHELDFSLDPILASL